MHHVIAPLLRTGKSSSNLLLVHIIWHYTWYIKLLLCVKYLVLKKKPFGTATCELNLFLDALVDSVNCNSNVYFVVRLIHITLKYSKLII